MYDDILFGRLLNEFLDFAQESRTPLTAGTYTSIMFDQRRFADRTLTRTPFALEIEGYGTVWNHPDEREMVWDRGCFCDSLALAGPNSPTKGIMLLGMHGKPYGMENPIGEWNSITEDAVGLKMRGLIYPVGVGEAFAHAVASKQLDSFSTGIDRRGDCYRDSMGRLHVRNAWLTEVSVVDEPAMPPAKITSARWVTDAGFFERLRAA